MTPVVVSNPIVTIQDENGTKIIATETVRYEFKKRVYNSIKRNLWIAPFLCCFTIPIVCFMPYILAVKFELVHPIWPYVSDTGTHLPVANYFSQILDIIAIFGTIIAWARYKQIKFYLNERLIRRTVETKLEIDEITLRELHRINFVSLFVAILASIGTIIVGNFRAIESLTIHLIGALLLFNSMTIYMLLATRLCRRLWNFGMIESNPISLTIIAILNLIFMICCFLFSMIASLHYSSIFKFYDHQHRLNWSPEMDGYVWHCFGTVSEWANLLMSSPFYFSLSQRMRSFRDWDRVTF
ncbi:serine/threonine-protein phosphatase 6 regulatory subunit 2-like [Sarcoptes scabiei]|nr:serine/threonine-protein phosphatase 6 regulatory subunit 2-like [Sarcoptes scabiei]